MNISSYFPSYYWLQDSDDAFIDIVTYLSRPLRHCNPHTPCPSCETGEENLIKEIISASETDVKVKGFTYHLNDFVYILPSSEERVYRIGQIASIHQDTPESEVFVGVRRFKRLPKPTNNEFFDDVSLRWCSDVLIVIYSVWFHVRNRMRLKNFQQS